MICPWCYIGKRRLEKALASIPEREVVLVRWHPFQLNPQIPKAGISRRQYRSAKFGSWERSLALDAQEAAGREEGIPFAFEKIERTPNTFDAHRLIWLAEKEGVQDAVVEALFRAYLIEGRDISNRETLLDVVAEAGLNRRRAEELLNSDEGIEAIRSAEEEARRLGVHGVPFFVLNNELALSGAVKPSAFVAAFVKLMTRAPSGE